jgi:hypothetical protein
VILSVGCLILLSDAEQIEHLPEDLQADASFASSVCREDSRDVEAAVDNRTAPRNPPSMSWQRCMMGVGPVRSRLLMPALPNML